MQHRPRVWVMSEANLGANTRLARVTPGSNARSSHDAK